MRGISWLIEELLAFQEGLYSIDLVSSENYIHQWFVVTGRNIWSILPHTFVEEWHSYLVYGKFQFQISVRRLVVLAEVVLCLSLIPPGIARIFPQSLHRPNAVVLCQIIVYPLPSTPFCIPYLIQYQSMPCLSADSNMQPAYPSNIDQYSHVSMQIVWTYYSLFQLIHFHSLVFNP